MHLQQIIIQTPLSEIKEKFNSVNMIHMCIYKKPDIEQTDRQPTDLDNNCFRSIFGLLVHQHAVFSETCSVMDCNNWSLLYSLTKWGLPMTPQNSASPYTFVNIQLQINIKHTNQYQFLSCSGLTFSPVLIH